MRAFIAIPLPEEATDALAGLMAAIPAGRVLPPENLHLTLAFLGDRHWPELSAVHEALEAISLAPFPLDLAGLDLVGHLRSQVLILTARPNGGLAALHRKIQGALHNAGLELGRSRFRPHVTLARLGRSPGAGERHRLALFLAERGAVAFPPFAVGRFTLFRSTLRPEGSVYEELASYPLRR